jgi:hypothetical protein
MFTWIGNSSSHEQQQWAVKVAEFLKVRSNETDSDIPIFHSTLCSNLLVPGLLGHLKYKKPKIINYFEIRTWT